METCPVAIPITVPRETTVRNWSDPTNWGTTGVPKITDDVKFNFNISVHINKNSIIFYFTKNIIA